MTTVPKKKAAPRKKAPSPAAEPAGVGQQVVTPVSAFKSAVAPTYLTLPSGHTILAKNPGLRAFLGTKAIPNSLMGLMTEALDKRAKPDVSKLMRKDDGGIDMNLAGDMMQMMDSVAVTVFVEPKCYPVPVNGVNADGTPEDRANLLYVDELEDEDKQFIFGWVSGGTRDVETFRLQHRESMESVSAGQDLGGSALGTAPNRAARRRRQ